MKVKAKFVCSEVAKFKSHKDDQGSARVSLHPVHSGSDENKEFWQYTPSGRLEMQIKNDAAEKYFEPGEEYLLTFEKAE